MKSNKERLGELRVQQLLTKCYRALDDSTRQNVFFSDLYHSEAAVQATIRWIDKFMSHPDLEIFSYEDIEKELEATISLTLLHAARNIINTEGNRYVIE